MIKRILIAVLFIPLNLMEIFTIFYYSFRWIITGRKFGDPFFTKLLEEI